MTVQDVQRLRDIGKWLLSEAQDVDEVWDEFDVAAYDLIGLAARIETELSRPQSRVIIKGEKT